ncbi:hypothetical protein Tco_1295732 [Tanacetum coccineum]
MYTFSPMMVANSRKHHCRVRSYTREVLVISTNLDIQKNHYPLDFRNRRGNEARIKNTWYNQGLVNEYQELLEYMNVHDNDASESSQPSWGKIIVADFSHAPPNEYSPSPDDKKQWSLVWGKPIQKLRQKGVFEESFSRHAAWIGGKLIQFMHTTMVPVQVKTMKIQAGIQVSRPRELTRQLQLWKCFGRLYFCCISLTSVQTSSGLAP